jgi:GNAT superfamily N-acetyltransferase
MISQVSNKIEIYKIANSGHFELLRDSLKSMPKGYSYDNPDLFEFYKYTVDDELLGIFVLRIRDKYIPEALHLGLIEVSNDFKGNGIGSKLMNIIIDYAKEHGYPSMTLRAHDDTRLPFYYKFGFKETKELAHPDHFMIKVL